MKKFIIAAMAASVLATPVLAQPYQGHDDRGRVEQRHDDRGRPDQYRGDRGHQRPAQYRGWRQGERFDSRRAVNYRVISNPRAYRLHDAPRGYRWVQSGNDAVLIGITSGIIASVIANSVR